MRWYDKARPYSEHNRRHPDKPLSLAAVGWIVKWRLESGRIKPCAFRCGDRAKARRQRDFADGHAQRRREEDKHRGV